MAVRHRMSVVGGKAEDIYLERVFRTLTDAVEKCRCVAGFFLSGAFFGLFQAGRRSVIGKQRDNLASLLRHRRSGSPCWRSN